MILKPTPLDISNRPGLTTLTRRVGRHADFEEAIKRSLRSRHRPGLRDFTAQTDADWTNALIDAWAATCDTLAFYSERLSHEAYLRTATEVFSVEALAELVGYRLSPATAAEVHLAFQADPDAAGDAEGEQVTQIEAGLAVKSIPLDDEKPQTFETVEPLRVKPAWNSVSPLRAWPQELDDASDGFFFDPAGQAIRTGARVVLMDEPMEDGGTPLPTALDQKLMRRVSSVTRTAGLVYASFDPDAVVPTLPTKAEMLLPLPSPLADLRVSSVAALKTSLAQHRWSRAQVLDGAAHLGLDTAVLDQSLRAQPHVATTAQPVLLTQTARAFGHNALSQRGDIAVTPAPGLLKDVKPETDLDLDNGTMALYLDRAYEEIAAGMFILMRARAKTGITEAWTFIKEAETTSIEYFATSAEVTRLVVPELWLSPKGFVDLGEEKLRNCAFFTQPEPVVLPDLPLSDAISGGDVLLDLPDLDLAVGQSLFLTGERTDLPGVLQSERQSITGAEVNGTIARLTLSPGLAHEYLRETVTLCANVARATHGETVDEILGSGDTRQVFQSFTLKQSPLTYVSADTAEGFAATLAIYVDGVLWHPVAAFDLAGPRDRVYVLTTLSDGKSRVTFGNGVMGARVPSGENNISALYRVGAGLSGRLRAGQLSLLSAKPRALSTVSNPLPSSGGSDGESLENARTNAPTAMLTLGRIVSLTDFADFARGFAGISKAFASWSWVAGQKGVFLTVTGDSDAPLALDTGVVPNLAGAIADASPDGTRVVIGNARVVPFTLSAKLRLDPDFTAQGGSDPVFDAVRADLRAAFAFSERGIGAPVRASDLITLIQQVPGVLAVDLDALHRIDQPAGLTPILAAEVPRRGGQGAQEGAEILVLTADPVTLGVF